MAIGMHIPTMKIKNGLPTSTIVIPFGGSACHIHVGIFVTLKLLLFNTLKNTSIRTANALNTSIEVRRGWSDMLEILALLSTILFLF